MNKINKTLAVVLVVLAAIFIYGILIRPQFLAGRLEQCARRYLAAGTQNTPVKEYSYAITLWGVPVASSFLKINTLGDQGVIQAVLDIVPLKLIRWVSANRAGVQLISTIDAVSGLPVSYEQRSFSRIKKGKAGRIILYQHENLTMKRRDYVDDILPDTRDPLSVLVWLTRQNDPGAVFLKSSMNIENTPWLVLAKSTPWNPEKSLEIAEIRSVLIKTNKAYQIKGRTPAVIYMLLNKGENVPLIIRFEPIKFFLPLEFELRP